MNPETFQKLLVPISKAATLKFNAFSAEVLVTRGGRIGSGMGTLLEALWGYFANLVIKRLADKSINYELAWMYGHQYNDFACVEKNTRWDPETRKGEIFRIEVKSMVASADESKAHFDVLEKEVTPLDLLVIFVWDWIQISDEKVFPKILDFFVAPALPIIQARDALHLARGGTFVRPGSCPDKCKRNACPHIGEPLNEQNRRERITGPESCRVSQKVSHAANFGGMVRMLKTSSKEARDIFRKLRAESDVAHEFISFMHNCFPHEEVSQYTVSEWKDAATRSGINVEGMSKPDMIAAIRTKSKNYRNDLRKIGILEEQNVREKGSPYPEKIIEEDRNQLEVLELFEESKQTPASVQSDEFQDLIKKILAFSEPPEEE